MPSIEQLVNQFFIIFTLPDCLGGNVENLCLDPALFAPQLKPQSVSAVTFAYSARVSRKGPDKAAGALRDFQTAALC